MKDFIKDIGPIFVSFIAVLVSFVSVVLVSYFNKQTLIQKQYEEERIEIYKKLNSFYGPLQRLLGKSAVLYEIFSYGRPKGFRTLVALLEGQKFKGNDDEILEQILKLGRDMDALILKNSGLIDDEELKEVLHHATTHFSLIRLAKDGKITGQIERFKEHVFPRHPEDPKRDLDLRLRAEILRLHVRLDELNREVNKGPLAQTLAKLGSWFRHVEADERGLDLKESDYQPDKIAADLQSARLTLESVEERLRQLKSNS